MKRFYLKAHAGPTIVKSMADKFRAAGLTVTSEGTEAVYFVQQSEVREHAVRDFLNQLHRTHQTVFGYGYRDVQVIREVSEEELAYPDKPAAPPVTTYNRIVKVELTLVEAVPGPTNNNDRWRIDVTKEFAPQYGGGEQVFTEHAIQIHRALDKAREMVTVHPAYRTEAK